MALHRDGLGAGLLALSDHTANLTPGRALLPLRHGVTPFLPAGLRWRWAWGTKRDPSAPSFPGKGVDIASGENSDDSTEQARRDAARILGRLGGLKGGPARAKKLSAKRRKEIAVVRAHGSLRIPLAARAE